MNNELEREAQRRGRVWDEGAMVALCVFAIVIVVWSLVRLYVTGRIG
jgi:hypothetical protein